MRKTKVVSVVLILILIYIFSFLVQSNLRMKSFIEKDKESFVYRISDCFLAMEDALESEDIEAINLAHSEFSIAIIRSRQKYDQLEDELSENYLSISDEFHLFAYKEATPLYSALKNRAMTNIDKELFKEFRLEYKKTSENIINLLREVDEE